MLLAFPYLYSYLGYLLTDRGRPTGLATSAGIALCLECKEADMHGAGEHCPAGRCPQPRVPDSSMAVTRHPSQHLATNPGEHDSNM